MEAAETFEHIVSSAKKKKPTQKCPPLIIPLLKTLKMTLQLAMKRHTLMCCPESTSSLSQEVG